MRVDPIRRVNPWYIGWTLEERVVDAVRNERMKGEGTGRKGEKTKKLIRLAFLP